MPPRFAVKPATVADIRAALSDGFADLRRRPALSLMFGLVYAVIGAALLSGLTILDQIWIVIAAGVGFPLVAPFLAAGLYDMSRRFEANQTFSARDIFLGVFRQQRREFGWMAFIVLFVFWMWAYQVRILLAIFLLNHSFYTLDGFLNVVMTTSDGVAFLAVGSVIGAIIATILFSLSVISLPLLLDKDIDFITAMITSFQSVFASPVVMIGWGAMIGALTLAAAAPALLGVIVIFPLLGHTSWHLYKRLITENQSDL